MSLNIYFLSITHFIDCRHCHDLSRYRPSRLRSLVSPFGGDVPLPGTDKKVDTSIFMIFIYDLFLFIFRTLQTGPSQDFDPIPSILLRKVVKTLFFLFFFMMEWFTQHWCDYYFLKQYIAYARKYVHPKLSPEAADELQV